MPLRAEPRDRILRVFIRLESFLRYTRAQRVERIDSAPMSDANSSAQCGQFFPEPVTRERLQSRFGERCNRISSPLALGLLGLALAVALWGFGSGLSLYLSLSDTSIPHLPKARLWSEHRVGLAAIKSHAGSHRLNARVYVNSGAFSPIPADPRLFLHEIPVMLSITGQPRSIPFFHSAIPLRSPPSTSL